MSGSASGSNARRPVPPAAHTRVVELAQAGRTVETIDVLREATRSELHESSPYVRSGRNQSGSPAAMARSASR